jgi:hypothetical protein
LPAACRSIFRSAVLYRAKAYREVKKVNTPTAITVKTWELTIERLGRIRVFKASMIAKMRKLAKVI